jgi:hypothetical protein
MSRRRQFGNVRKLPSGRWQARYEVEGGRSVTAPTSFPAKAEAARWLAAVETEQARGTWVDPGAGSTLLDTYAWGWLRGHARLAKRTREIYDEPPWEPWRLGLLGSNQVLVGVLSSV